VQQTSINKAKALIKQRRHKTSKKAKVLADN